jgi:tetratricopeptide (TPR) repeat protein
MPTDAVKAFNVAVAHREAGDYSTSVQAYQSAIAMEPRMAEAYLNVAFVLSELRRFVEAEHAYRHALGVRKWPAQTAAAASHNLGVLLDSLGRSSDATAAYKQALKYKPDFGPSLEILESAQDTTANAIEAGEPPTFVALINAGNEAFERGAHSDAERHYRLAVPLRDVRWEGAAYVGLGAALHGGGRLQEAKHVLMAGAKLNPSSPGMLSNLATVRSDLGEWKGAAGTWRRALALTGRRRPLLLGGRIAAAWHAAGGRDPVPAQRGRARSHQLAAALCACARVPQNGVPDRRHCCGRWRRYPRRHSRCRGRCRGVRSPSAAAPAAHLATHACRGGRRTAVDAL